jgi:thiol:disulfide interchange protein
MLLFATLGLGLALPFLLLGFVPALRRLLPRPGPWMGRFQRWMALPMALTVLALAWLAWRLGGPGFALGALVLAALLIALLRVAWSAPGLASRPRGAGLAMLGLAAVAVGLFVMPSLYAAQALREEAGLLDASPFSEAALAEARAAGKPVFVWFTADWCLTCKVNESTAIERVSTRDAFAEAGAVALRGDWTRRDEEITRFLTEQGAAGVPLYLWYPAGSVRGEQLPQVLTPGLLAELARGSDRPVRPAPGSD